MHGQELSVHVIGIKTAGHCCGVSKPLGAGARGFLHPEGVAHTPISGYSACPRRSDANCRVTR